MQRSMNRVARVLVVEDDEDLRNLTAVVVRKCENVAVTVARDGREALQRLVDERPDVILLDLSLPIVSGFDVLAAILATTPPRPAVIVISAAADYVDRDRLDPTVVMTVIRKPWDPHILMVVVQGLADSIVGRATDVERDGDGDDVTPVVN